MTARAAVRHARRGDRAGILAVVGEAFSHGGHDSQEEVDIVRASWESGRVADGMDLVAVLPRDDGSGDDGGGDDGEGAVVGHVMGAWGELGGRAVVGVAPLGVAPAHQGQGIGGALMAEVLRRADEAACPLVVLLGNPGYYGRFGFGPAGRHGLVYPPVGAHDPHFMVRWRAGEDPAYQGEFRYCWELARP